MATLYSQISAASEHDRSSADTYPCTCSRGEMALEPEHESLGIAGADTTSSSPTTTSPSYSPRAVASVSPSRPAVWLPAVKPLPLPGADELLLISQMSSGQEDSRRLYLSAEGLRFSSYNPSTADARSSISSSSSSTRQRTSSSKHSLDDFLTNSSSQQKSRVGARRPTQRRAIDDNTSVPAELAEKMIALGNETRARQTHALSFAPPDGEPYLRRHDAPARQAPSQLDPDMAVAALLSRPSSACSACVHSTMEDGVARWNDAVPMQAF